MKRIVFSCLLCASALFSQEVARSVPAKVSPIIVPDPEQPSRSVVVDDRSVVSLSVRLRFTTFIVLPEGEQILDFVCGDKDNFVVNGFPSTNFASVKPSKSLAQTNLNLITASGRIYSFVLTEGSEAHPDLKVFVELKDGARASDNKPRFVAATQVEDYRAQVELAHTQAAAARKEAAEQVLAAQKKFEAETVRLKVEAPHAMQFEYTYKDLPGFNVSAIYHDGNHTYIKASPQELPVLYEVKDGKENLIEFRFENGLYAVTKVLDRFYLRIGKRRMDVERHGS